MTTKKNRKHKEFLTHTTRTMDDCVIPNSFIYSALFCSQSNMNNSILVRVQFHFFVCVWFFCCWIKFGLKKKKPQTYWFYDLFAYSCDFNFNMNASSFWSWRLIVSSQFFHWRENIADCFIAYLRIATVGSERQCISLCWTRPVSASGGL